VARDRQRAKRRRAQRNAARPNPRSTRDVEREVGLGPDDDAVDSPLGEGTGAPDPLLHSSAEVDEARLAEAGAVPPDVGDDDELAAGVYADELEDDERAPDAVEGDAEIARPPGYEDRAPRRRRGRFITFLGHCVDELRRVQWPNRRQVGQATAVVLGFVVIAGSYLGVLDAVWQPLINAIL
jgi:preprotein translocase subunit SecE